MNQVSFRSDMTVELVDHMGSDTSIIAAMLVSTAADQAQTLAEDATKQVGRINFLMKNRHGTPFEHNAMCFYIEAPIFVFREFHRHRVGWSYNELSGRYRELDPVFYVPDRQRKMIQVGKPGAYTFESANSNGQYDFLATGLKDAYKFSYQQYKILLSDGIAKEVARMCLPVATYSAMYATCNARSLMHFLSLRTIDDRATFPSFPMYEISRVADAMELEFSGYFPLTHRAFCENGRVAP